MNVSVDDIENLSLRGISENIRTIYEKNLGKKCGITRFGIKSYSTKNNKKSSLYLGCSHAPGGDIGTRGKTCAPQLPTLYPVLRGMAHLLQTDSSVCGSGSRKARDEPPKKKKRKKIIMFGGWEVEFLFFSAKLEFSFGVWKCFIQA
jgi:hypothetical protein